MSERYPPRYTDSSPTLNSLTDQQNVKNKLLKLFTLLRIWGTAAIVWFLIIAIFFTLFLGRNQVIPNETIYENHFYTGKPGTYRLYSDEGYGLTAYGKNGLIVNKEINPNAFRILFIGDSFVMAREVHDDKKFTQVVERRWNEINPNQPIQTLNIGQLGHDMRAYLSFGRNMDYHFQPHLVFIFLNESDFNIIARRPKLLEKVKNGVPEPLVSPQRSNFVAELVNDLRVRAFFGQLQKQTYGFINKGQGGGPPPANANEEDLIDPAVIDIQLRALQEIWGDRLVILYHSQPPLSVSEAPPTLNDNITQALERLNIPYISLYETYYQSFQKRKAPMGFNNSILGRGHLNNTGHALVAEQIIKFLDASQN